MNKIILTVFFVCVVFLSKSYACPFTGTVEKIVDGDTIHVNDIKTDETYKIRFLGIDAPELHFYGQTQGEYAEEAKQFLEDNIPIGTQVKVVCDVEEKDRYGRVLGHIFKGRTNINLQLLKNGLAVNYIIYPNLKYVDEYAKAANYAIKNKLGMFSEKDYELPYVFRINYRGGKATKWVCDRKSKECLDPEEYVEVPIPDRVFFMKKSDTKKYQK